MGCIINLLWIENSIDNSLIKSALIRSGLDKSHRSYMQANDIMLSILKSNALNALNPVFK
jgi:hypothetical protein